MNDQERGFQWRKGRSIDHSVHDAENLGTTKSGHHMLIAWTICKADLLPSLSDSNSKGQLEDREKQKTRTLTAFLSLSGAQPSLAPSNLLTEFIFKLPKPPVQECGAGGRNKHVILTF